MKNRFTLFSMIAATLIMTGCYTQLEVIERPGLVYYDEPYADRYDRVTDTYEITEEALYESGYTTDTTYVENDLDFSVRDYKKALWDQERRYRKGYRDGFIEGYAVGVHARRAWYDPFYDPWFYDHYYYWNYYRHRALYYNFHPYGYYIPYYASFYPYYPVFYAGYIWPYYTGTWVSYHYYHVGAEKGNRAVRSSGYHKAGSASGTVRRSGTTQGIVTDGRRSSGSASATTQGRSTATGRSTVGQTRSTGRSSGTTVQRGTRSTGSSSGTVRSGSRSGSSGSGVRSSGSSGNSNGSGNSGGRTRGGNNREALSSDVNPQTAGTGRTTSRNYPSTSTERPSDTIIPGRAVQGSAAVRSGSVHTNRSATLSRTEVRTNSASEKTSELPAVSNRTKPVLSNKSAQPAVRTSPGQQSSRAVTATTKPAAPAVRAPVRTTTTKPGVRQNPVKQKKSDSGAASRPNTRTRD